LRNQRADQEDQDELNKQDITKEKPPLPGRRAWRVEVAPKTSLKTLPTGLMATTRAAYPAKAAPLHLTATLVTYRCGIEAPRD